MAGKAELRACPLCGGKGVARHDGNGDYVECLDCLCRTGFTYLDTLAIAAWNKRPIERSSAAPAEEVEAAAKWANERAGQYDKDAEVEFLRHYPEIIEAARDAASKLRTLAAAATRAAQERRLAEWQPIETAPKDGSRFLAYEGRRGDPKRYECWWQDDFAEWSGWQNDWDNEPEPTHWQPLPDPPA